MPATGETPNAASDQASTPADTAVTVDVLANDGSLTSTLTPSSVALSISPKNGSTSIDPSTGKITYTPAKGFSGTDTFAYIVADTLGQYSAPTSVEVIVGAEAGPPKFSERLRPSRQAPTHLPRRRIPQKPTMWDMAT